MNNTNSAFDSRIECVGGNATTAGTGELHLWSNGVNIASHDGGTKGLRLGGVLVTPTAYDLNTIAKASSVEYVTGSTHTWNGARVIMVNTTTGSGCTITMPSVTGVGNRQVTIFNYGSQNVVINRSGTNVFNGNQTSITLSNNNENVTLLEVTTAAFVGFIQTSFNSTVRTLNGV